MAVPGDVLAGRYELVEPIGSGGMATVWRARDLRLRRQVAVKLLRPEFAEDPDFVRRFEVEARNAASLSHPNVAHTYDTDRDGPLRFIVMELVDGPTVADLIRERAPLDPPIAVGIAASAARGLAAAHRRGLVHRDVKPANLLLGRDGRVRLADFGIARALTASRATTPGTVLGSVPYLSPEQARGEDATASSDLFSLGVVLFEMLTGRLPWTSDTVAGLTTARLNQAAPVPSDIVHGLPAGLDSIVRRTLEQDPGRRYPSARALADALGAWLRRHQITGDRRRGLLDATTALVAAVAPGAVASRAKIGVVGAPTAGRTTAGASRTATAPRQAPGATRAVAFPAARGSRPAADPPSARGNGDAAADAAGRGRSRRIDVLLAALAVALIGVTAFGMLSTGGGAPASPSPSPTPPVFVIVPPSPTPSATASLLPTPAPTAAPTPRLTPRPTPRPTPQRTPAPVARPTPLSTLAAPAAAVVAFYNAAEAHDWPAAIALWSPSMQQRYPPREWLIDRFSRTTRIDLTRIRTVSVDAEAGTARVAVSLIEYRTVEPSPRTFVGSWDLVRIDGRWLLDEPQF